MTQNMRNYHAECKYNFHVVRFIREERDMSSWTGLTPGETELVDMNGMVKTEIREIKNGFLEEFKQKQDKL